jgi:CBS domain-containing protein
VLFCSALRGFDAEGQTVTVEKIMSRKVVSISMDDTLDIVRDIMELGSVRHIPVVSRGTVVGVVSQRDLLKASLSNVMGIPAKEQAQFLKQIHIAEVMSKPAITIAPEAPVRQAARSMAERKIGCLPVLEHGKLVGIVTETDVLAFFASLP